MNGGQLAAKWLKAQGVEKIFVLVGEHVLPIVNGAAEEGIEVIGCRHEMNAVLAAEAYARVTRTPGVAVVTAGPGVTNAVSGLAQANSCGSPVLLIAGRTSVQKRYTGAFQDIDGRALVAGVTKWCDTVFEGHRVPYYLELAWRRMLAGRPGAVMLEIPHNVAKWDCDEVAINTVELPEPAGASKEAIARAIALIGEAEKPILIAGGGAFWSGADDAVRAFCERTRIPMTSVNAARGIIPDGDEISLGPLSEGGFCITQADLVILAGTKLDASVTHGGPPLFGGAEKIIQIDIEPISVGLNRQPELAIHGDVRAVLEQITDAYDGKTKDAWLATAKEFANGMHAAWESQTLPLEGSPVPPGRVPAEVLKSATRDTILISDGGDIHTWAITVFPAYRPGALITTHDALGAIGVGVGYALGAKAAAPDRPVLMCIGDGSFGFGAIDLETCARYNLPVVVVVANNGAWGNIRHEQGKQLGTKTGATQLAPVAYEKIAEAFGGYGERVENSEEVGPAIARALASGKVAVVNVICQQDVVSPITEMVGGMMELL